MSEEIDMNKLALVELRLLFDRLTSLYDGIKVKILALIAGEVALIPFIFSNDFPNLENLTETLFFSFGAFLMGASFIALLWAASTADWSLPFGSGDSRNIGKVHRNKTELLEFLKSDYENCIDSCLKRIKTRAMVFNVTLLILVLGISILFVIKYS